MYGLGHGFHLPLPATFVLARGTGRIRYAFVDQDLTKRSRLLRIEAALQALTLAGGGMRQLPPRQQQAADWQSEEVFAKDQSK